MDSSSPLAEKRIRDDITQQQEVNTGLLIVENDVAKIEGEVTPKTEETSEQTETTSPPVESSAEEEKKITFDLRPAPDYEEAVESSEESEDEDVRELEGRTVSSKGFEVYFIATLCDSVVLCCLHLLRSIVPALVICGGPRKKSMLI